LVNKSDIYDQQKVILNAFKLLVAAGRANKLSSQASVNGDLAINMTAFLL
jgi:hypothetical protein